MAPQRPRNSARDDGGEGHPDGTPPPLAVGPPPEVAYHEVPAKTVTRLPGTADPWFLGRYGMNLYRGCEHGCVYCDGRAERYYVPGDFAREIQIKVNAPALLERELARVREPGFVMIGGGVCDAYQPAEVRYRLARRALELCLEHHLPVHVLTKSELVRRDLELLARINEQSRAILSFSINTLDEEVRALFEPGAAPLARRWELLAEARTMGLGVGVMMMPVLPGISDMADTIMGLVGEATSRGADFVCGGGLTLRPGVQKEGTLALIEERYPQHLPGYVKIFGQERASGAALPRYYERINQRISDALRRHEMPGRIPRRLFTGQVPCYTEVAVLLEHHEFERFLSGGGGPPLGRVGFAIQKWARGRFARRRGRHFTWRDLELEFRQLVASGEICSLPGVIAAARPLIEELLASTRGAAR